METYRLGDVSSRARVSYRPFLIRDALDVAADEIARGTRLGAKLILVVQNLDVLFFEREPLATRWTAVLPDAAQEGTKWFHGSGRCLS